MFIDKNRILALKGEEMGSSVFKNKTERIEIEEASKKFIDRLVNGAYGDENKLNTTIYGYSGKSMLAQQIVEGTLELPPNAWNMHEEFCQEVFFSAGYNPFYEPHKVLVIADPSKERFLKSIKRADGTSDDDMEMLRRKIKTGQELPSDFLEPTLRIAREGFYGSKLEGARIIFKGGIRWIDIADYIVDLPNGKLINIKEAKVSGSKRS